MQLFQSMNNESKLRCAIREYHYISESELIDLLLPLAKLDEQYQHKANSKALELATQLRDMARNGGNIQNLLNQYSLSTEEGIVLMCLAEALLRVPDSTTADRLIRDKLAGGDWSTHIGSSDSLFVNASAWGLFLSGSIVSLNEKGRESHRSRLQKTVGALGEPVIRHAMRQAMGIMGTQFVLGRTIQEATNKAAQQEALGYCYSYDMLGEGARTTDDAQINYNAYKNAIEHLGSVSEGKGIHEGPGISVKLSAIHPRYEFFKYERLKKELVPRLKVLALMAKKHSLGFTIDAEEANRLDVSLDIIEEVFSDSDLDGWEGFGFAVQAYQKRALPVLHWAIDLSERVGRKLMLRLVKGAYWDSEIKIAQVDGLESYPVFTRKASTDVSYQACAGLMLDNRNTIFPQFATHNAYSVAYILERARGDLSGFEFQRLHGMGDGLYERFVEERSIPVRIYAPVGQHKSLLAYLVRRLLENGANSSFVNNIVDETISLESLVEDPIRKMENWKEKANPHIPLPIELVGNQRSNSKGFDVTHIPRLLTLISRMELWEREHLKREVGPKSYEINSTNPSNVHEVLGSVRRTSSSELSRILERAECVYETWSKIAVEKRASHLLRIADALEQNMDELIVLCTKEAGKTIGDGISEVREAIDFCRYYANESTKVCNPHFEWGGDGQLYSRGIAVCISPWNFPLAIFLGQVAAALATGNVVIAKPADTTSLIASRTVELMEQSGLPKGVVQLIFVEGLTVSEKLLPDPRVALVMFTGSTAVGNKISKLLSTRIGRRVPLIAETGGQNCMIVDSTALPEQVVDDVVSSGFQSAGQRCSALRVLYVQEEVADEIIAMIIGAMKELYIGDPSNLHTDIGPVIDERALAALNTHSDFMLEKGTLLYKCELSGECNNGIFFAPRLYEIEGISLLEGEVFGPVVHVVRYKPEHLDRVLDEINSTGFGLTSGVHSRIQSTGEKVVSKVKAGNIYINRNTIGAVVGVQPFGGHGFSGTGPKSGGPSYLYRLSRQRTDHQDKLTRISFGFDNDCSNETPLDNFSGEEVDIVDHANSVCRFIDSLHADDVLELSQQLVDQVKFMADEAVKRRLKPETLPGPTGELNLLHIEPRGQVLCIQQGKEQIENSIRQIAAAILYGNRVVHISSDNVNFESLIEDAELSNFYQCLSVGSQKELVQIVASAHVDGIAISGGEELAQWVDAELASRNGPLIPLIVETTGPALPLRFFLEKVSSCNTTASGGNASLLAMTG